MSKFKVGDIVRVTGYSFPSENALVINTNGTYEWGADYPIIIQYPNGDKYSFNLDGRYFHGSDVELIRSYGELFNGEE